MPFPLSELLWPGITSPFLLTTAAPWLLHVFPSWSGYYFSYSNPKNVGLSPSFPHSSGVWAHSDEALSKEVGRRRCHKGKLLPPLGRENLPSCSPLLGSLPGTLTRSGWVTYLCSLSALRGNMQRMGVLEPHTPSLGPSANIYSNVTLGKSLSLFQSISLNKGENKTY